MKNKIYIVAFMSFLFSAQTFYSMELQKPMREKLEKAASANDDFAFCVLLSSETPDELRERNAFLDSMGYPQVEGTDSEISEQMKAYRGEVENFSTITRIEEAIKKETAEAIFYSCNVKVLKTKEGNISPLDVAIASGNPEIVKRMMDNSEGKAFNYSALSRAKGNMIDALLEYKPFTQEQKQQMLFNAIEGKNETLALALIEKKVVDVNDKKQDNTYYPTFLLFAMYRKCTQAVMISLIDAGSKVDCVDFQKNTPLHYAVNSGCVTVVRILLERMTPEDINAKNDEYNTALDLQLLVKIKKWYKFCVSILNLM